MGHDGVECSNVIEPQLSECALEDFDATLLRCFVSCGGINRLYNLVDLRRDNRIYARSEWPSEKIK